MSQLTFFFMAYTAFVIVISLTMIYTATLHVSSYNRMRADILRYISYRMQAEGRVVSGVLARLHERIEKLSVSFSDVRADEEVFFRSGGSRDDFRAINRQVQKNFNARVLPLIQQETRTAHQAEKLQERLMKEARLEVFATLKDRRVQKFLVNYFVRLLDVLGRASAAGFILSSLVIVLLISRTQVFNTYGEISLATSFIFASAFGTYFISSHYTHRRLLNTALLVILGLAVAGLLTARVF